jgi:hypothetical protein
VFLQGKRGRAHKKGGVDDLEKLRNEARAEWSNFDLFSSWVGCRGDFWGWLAAV